jgi:hypothetical protein
MDSGTAPGLVLAGGLLFVLFWLVVFLVIRGFWLWYWRVDAIVERLDEIRDELRLQRLRGQGYADGAAQARPPALGAAAAVPPSPQRLAGGPPSPLAAPETLSDRVWRLVERLPGMSTG